MTLHNDQRFDLGSDLEGFMFHALCSGHVSSLPPAGGTQQDGHGVLGGAELNGARTCLTEPDRHTDTQTGPDLHWETREGQEGGGAAGLGAAVHTVLSRELQRRRTGDGLRRGHST